MTSLRCLIVAAVLLCGELLQASESTCTQFQPTRGSISVRGGDGNAKVEVRRKKKKKSKKKKMVTKSKSADGNESSEEPKELIKEVMRETDSAQALGDAIRARADELLRDSENPILQSIDESIASVGYAMGTSHLLSTADDTDGGGVEAAPTSVLANYFLKSHGGAHALQSVCSFLAVFSSIGAVLLPQIRLVLIKRTMLFAMTKHLSGLLAGSTMAARAIPEIGLSKARQWIEKLALDPVSQYVFYSALLLLWLPMDNSASVIPMALPFVGKLVPFLLVGPILIREVISTAFVTSDILVLLSTTASNEDDGSPASSKALQVGKLIVNAGMSLLVTPSVWRESDAAKRQAILAKLTSRSSLVMELLVGLFICFDAVASVWQFSISTKSTRPKPLSVGKRLLCARLYLNFLWVRRKRIRQVAPEIRGGAAQLPHRFLDLLIDPKAAMGLPSRTLEEIQELNPEERSWRDYAIMALGLDE